MKTLTRAEFLSFGIDPDNVLGGSSRTTNMPVEAMYGDSTIIRRTLSGAVSVFFVSKFSDFDFVVTAGNPTTVG